MKLVQTKISGVYVLEPDLFEDERGSLVKPFNRNTFIEHGLTSDFEENYYSLSNKDVIRGMHLQQGTHDHAKLVYVTCGSILDVVLDLRKNSPTYGEYFSLELSNKNHKAMYMPKGCAHGFLSLEDNTCTVYLQEKARSPEHEVGINIDSFGMNWNVENPIISMRDRDLQSLHSFDSPFIYS